MALDACLLLAFSTLTVRTSPAHAQDPPVRPSGASDASRDAQAGTVPPQLIASDDASYPPEALAARIEANVVLRLKIDKTGQVVEADLVEPAGRGFDEVALESVRRFRFEPARRAGVPVAARILYRYTFRLPAVAAPPAPPVSATAPLTEPVALPNPPPRPPPQPIEPKPIEVTVTGQQSAARRLRESAEAVTVVETYRAKQQTRDLGEVLAATEGVSVRRTGGLGSFSRLWLNGLGDHQIQFFFDEVPLDISGYSFGVATVPLQMIDRIEIYRGVLPVRLGADALGGAINLVPERRDETWAAVSYTRGSFGTSRVSVLGRYHHAPSGLLVGAGGWYDYARNDYQIQVDVAEKSGRLVPTTVRRQHDVYRGYGASLELGVVDKPWAKRLLVQLFGATYDKDLQHNVLMTIPYGEARYGETVVGGTVRYEQPLPHAVSLSAIVSASRRTIELLDVAGWIYDWYGQRTRQREILGETRRQPQDATIWQDNLFGRAQLEWRPLPAHGLRLASTARYASRTGKERASKGPNGTDPLAGRRGLFTIMTGLEYEMNALDGRPEGERTAPPKNVSRDYRLQNLAFLKHYFFSAKGEGVLALANLEDLNVVRQRVGVGDGARLRLTDWASAKASYEWATRFPSTDELYGDGTTTVIPNTDLVPETSHNVNVELKIELPRTPIGRFSSGVNGFLRASDRFITPIADSLSTQYKNVSGARALGVESSLSWTSPGSWVVLDGNATWQDVRNTASEGEFGAFSGDRIPNRPWLFGNWSARVQWRHVLLKDDELSPFYIGRYVRSFYRNWESIGDRDFKAVIPDQVSHAIGLCYSNQWPFRSSTTLEIDNVTSASLYDFFGVQRPGRSVSLKVTGSI